MIKVEGCIQLDIISLTWMSESREISSWNAFRKGAWVVAKEDIGSMLNGGAPPNNSLNRSAS